MTMVLQNTWRKFSDAGNRDPRHKHEYLDNVWNWGKSHEENGKVDESEKHL